MFADWLQERGDPRADGYRALGALRKRPHTVTPANATRDFGPLHVWGDRGGLATASMRNGNYAPALLDRDWWVLLPDDFELHRLWRYFATRREAEDAAALAFASIPAARRTELLAGEGMV